MRPSTKASQQPCLDSEAEPELGPRVSVAPCKVVRPSRTAMLAPDEESPASRGAAESTKQVVKPSRTAMFAPESTKQSPVQADKWACNKSRTAMLPDLNDIRVSRTAMFQTEGNAKHEPEEAEEPYAPAKGKGVQTFLRSLFLGSSQ